MRIELSTSEIKTLRKLQRNLAGSSDYARVSCILIHLGIDSSTVYRLFLLPYSSKLNLIERLWKFLRKKMINTVFYRTKASFRKAIKDSFEHDKEVLEIFLTFDFRLINSQTIFV